MHILYFHQHFSTPRGATGTRSYEMARRLVRDGHRVTMVCGSYVGSKTGLDGPFVGGRRTGVVEDIQVIEFDLSYSNGTNFARRAWLFLKFALDGVGLAMTYRYDRVFATTTPLTAGIPGIFARWLRGKPFIFEVRDLWPELPRAMGVITNPLVLGLMSALEWASYRSAHRVVALSPGIADGVARLGVERNRIALVPNGCDLDIFSGTHLTPWRPEGVRDSDLMAIFTGTHGVANGLDAVLDAAGVLKARGRDDIRIVLMGDGKLKPRLLERARAEGLENVIFHPPVDKARLAGLMASADLGLQCLANVPAFYYGTSPNKFFDYIAAGLPVLNNYPGWLAELITTHGCGMAVPAEDPIAFAGALEKAADDREALQVWGRNASRLARDQFDRARLADAWVDWVTSPLPG
ncbi:glycosyltransferase family 4 protein [Brevundimonas sp.]|uniref:glycosyltransferase family 4 protein n=1 Tax=Brevundimonas sp. TaxID=1871086 RepID=UPI002FC79A27